MHSLWNTFTRPLLDIIHPDVIVEIGTYKGETTIPLAHYCTEKGGAVHTIDPEPQANMAKLTQQYAPHLIFHTGLSLNVLPMLPAFDAILIDGDHNWYTVYHELNMVEKMAQQYHKTPLVLLHDIDWPYARRDLYYAPERIPTEFRQPYKQSGIDPATNALTDEGINPGKMHALYAHGIRNGVLSAAEDFLQEHPDWIMHTIPGFHGLGIMAPRILFRQQPDLQAFVTRTMFLSDAITKHIRDLETERQQMSLKHFTVQRLKKELDTRADHVIKVKKELHDAYVRLHELREEQAAYKNLSTPYQETAARIARMEGTLSWRITAPLRRIGRWMAWIHNHTRTWPKRVWTAMGEPFPQAARFVRHDLMRRILRKKPMVQTAPKAPAEEQEILPAVAVIIPCHNYGRFLADAIRSVLDQTHKPAEIIVVDDASDDDTEAVTRLFEQQGVRYMRGDWRNVGEARNTAMRITTSPYLVFLDADDLLHPEYLRCGARALQNNVMAGIAYADHRQFGKLQSYRALPDAIDEHLFDTINMLSSTCMVRRQALEQAGGWTIDPLQHGDWVTWRRVLAKGWTAIKSDGLFFYRYHGSHMYSRMRSDVPYHYRSGLSSEPITLCLALSGRTWAWPLTRAFLDTQQWDHSKIRLIILDTSQDAVFSEQVRSWLGGCDYAETTYRAVNVGLKGIADRPRDAARADMNIACSAIYNTFARMVDTPLTFILEDDVIPPLDAISRLVSAFEPDVISVSGMYHHRNEEHQPVCWIWNDDGWPVFPEASSGMQSIGGTGFGCLAVRSAFLKQYVFQGEYPFANYDQNFFASFTRNATYRALIDWECACKHYQSPTLWY